jgi:hypothetical protein
MNPAAEMLEERVRERAYHLWEQGGRPPGRDQEFWQLALELIATEEPAPTVRARPARAKSTRAASSRRRSK